MPVPKAVFNAIRYNTNMALQSSHFKATAPAISGNVLGNFDKGNHTFIYDKDTKLVMEKRNDSLYQVLYKNGKEVEAHRFEIVFGSKTRTNISLLAKQQYLRIAAFLL